MASLFAPTLPSGRPPANVPGLFGDDPRALEQDPMTGEMGGGAAPLDMWRPVIDAVTPMVRGLGTIARAATVDWQPTADEIAARRDPRAAMAARLEQGAEALTPKTLDDLALVAGAVPVVGDAIGLANDVRHYVTEPDSRTWTNYGLTAAGLIPGVPSMASMFVGTKHLPPAMWQDLAKARDMERAGHDARAIHAATGMFRGLDNNWRGEINDQAFVQKAPLQPFKQDVGDVWDHPGLFDAQPDLATMQTWAERDPSYWGAYYQPRPGNRMGEIKINSEISPEQQRSTMLHELQHAVQHADDLDRGGNQYTAREAVKRQVDAVKLRIDNWPEGTPGKIHAIKDLKRLEFLERRNDDDLYRRITGEVEARLTQARAGMSDAERRSTFPLQNFDVFRPYFLRIGGGTPTVPPGPLFGEGTMP